MKIGEGELMDRSCFSSEDFDRRAKDRSHFIGGSRQGENLYVQVSCGLREAEAMECSVWWSDS